jgi:hypothetical protein
MTCRFNGLMNAEHLTGFCCACAVALALANPVFAGDEPQYEFGDIRISQASSAEPIRERLSVGMGATYLDQGARAWYGARKCISCHTNGTYMLVRPALTAQLGRPSKEVRDNFVTALKELASSKHEELLKSTRPAQVIYAAAGLAEWDAHLTKSLSPETQQALQLMFEIQLPTGTWGSADCWPPYESDAFHLATVAAIAVADAPGWLTDLKQPSLSAAVTRLKRYLRTQRKSSR